MNLKLALDKCKPGVAKRSTLPITTCVLVQSKGGHLTLTTTNLEIAICVVLGAKVDQGGAFCVEFGPLYDWVKSVPDDAKEYPPVPKVGGRSCEIKDLRDSP